MNEFKRERKYLVLKLSDIYEHLPAPLIDHLSSISEEVAAGRQRAGKTPLLGVFVEEDWPEHEIVWAMIKDRVEGRPNALAAANDRIRELETMMLRWQKEYYGKGGLYDDLQSQLAAERAVSDRLLEALKLADIQYMGCGGNLTPDEIVSAMRRVIQTAITEVEAIRKEKPE